jgi:diguanylate cyclase (GGDEF)-like protein/PAS domain S-box-containing protein
LLDLPVAHEVRDAHSGAAASVTDKVSMRRIIELTLSKHGIAIILALAVVGVFSRSWLSYQTTTGAVKQAEAAYETRRDVMTILTDVLDQETGVRGYVSTRQRAFLAPYEAGRSRIDADMSVALHASADADASSIEPSIVHAITIYREWRDGIAGPLIANPGRPDAQALQARGKALVDRMRADVESSLDILDAISASYSQRTQEQLTVGAIVSLGIALALLAALAAMLRARRMLEVERDRFVSTAQDMFVVASMDGYFINVNPAVERILNRPRIEFLGKSIMTFVHPEDVDRTKASLIALASGASIEAFRNRYQAADGSYRWMCWNTVPDMGRRRIYASGRDETDRVALDVEREHLAFNDLVTGLPNRASFLAHASRALTAARAMQYELVIILFDLDGFKAVNDAHGHSVGDDVLREVARRVRAALRKADLVARIGGDEFTILLQAHVGSVDVDIVIGKIQATFREPLQVQGHELRLDASIGVARYPVDGDTTEALLVCADHAMYRAKRLAGLSAATWNRS